MDYGRSKRTRVIPTAKLSDAAKLGKSIYSPGVRASNVLQMGAVPAEAETVTIGADVYEAELCTVATGVNTSLGQWNNTNDPILATIAAHGAVAGDLFACESEITKVLRVVDANNVVLARGRCGTTIAAHADAVAITKGNGVVAGRIPAGVTAMTATLFLSSLEDEINNAAAANGERPASKAATQYATINAKKVSATELLVFALTPGVNALATTETLAGANNAWAAATLTGGVAGAFKRAQRATRVPTAVEVALGTMEFAFDFAVAFAEVHVVVTASGLPVAWVGARIISTAPDVVRIDNTGATDWAASDTVTVIAYE